MREKLFNLWLRVRYNYFKPSERKKFFGISVLDIRQFDKLAMEKFTITKLDFYNNNDVLFESDQVMRRNNRLIIDCLFNPTTATTWQGTRRVNWLSGCLTTPVLINYGTWIITAKMPNCWPAIWLLREKHVNEDGFTTITPEVDILETIHGNFQHTVHHTPSTNRYSTDGMNNKLKYDYDFHEFAVDMRKDGYDFYIDGILTGRFRGEGNMVSDKRLYLILNNAANNGDIDHDKGDFYRMEVSSVKVLKNEFTTKTGESSKWEK